MAKIPPSQDTKNAHAPDNKLEVAITLVRGYARVATVEDIAALRYLIARASVLARAAEDALERQRIKAKGKPSPKNEQRKKMQQHVTAMRKVAAKAALSLYETTMVLGRAIGDIWYTELQAMRTESVFVASLCDQLLRHATPSADIQIRDMVNLATLEKMIAKAKVIAAKSGDAVGKAA